MKKIKNKSLLLIPDCQVKAGVSLDYLSWIGQYVADRRPDYVVQIGDFADMESLSSYDKGKKSFEGRRYRADVDAAVKGMELLTKPFRGIKGYAPRMVLTLGNHEDRINRVTEEDSKLDGTLGIHDLQYEKFGWEVYPFLQPVVIEQTAFCHFFPRSGSGAVTQTRRGASSAKAQLQREGRSAVAGHQQGLDMCPLPLAGKLRWGIIAGSCYTHNETYLSPQGNDHWRGVVVLHNFKDGSFDPMVVGLDYLQQRYG